MVSIVIIGCRCDIHIDEDHVKVCLPTCEPGTEHSEGKTTPKSLEGECICASTRCVPTVDFDPSTSDELIMGSDPGGCETVPCVPSCAGVE